ncbi:MAG: glycosyltransferase [Candidatus Saccharibacteria bacterium]|nr:glycosyltransferase [Candidatus Saccharibacteria bacterium]
MAKKVDAPKAAIITDWLTTYGGMEKVVKSITDVFPDAPIFTSQYSEKQVAWFRDRDVRTGWVNYFPAKLRKVLMVPRLWYFGRLHHKLREFDIIISVASGEAKGVKTQPHQLHISYLQGPPVQYYWSMYDEYVKNPGFGWLNWLVRPLFRLSVGPLRRRDYQLAQRPTVLLANSTYCAEEIMKHYHRQAEVLFPPVGVNKFTPIDESDDFYITTSRQVNWKRLDVAIRACMMTGRQLILVGDGAEHQRLRHIAQGSDMISFVPLITQSEELNKLVARAKGFLFPSVEPFGIAPIEALSAGVPVIALQKGGARDYIEDGVNGVFFTKQTPESMAAALDRFEAMTLDKQAIIASAQRFSEQRFQREIAAIVARHYREMKGDE